MEKIKLVIEGERFIDINNPFGEISKDYVSNNTFVFEKGKIYGILCEHGGGGESVSLLLSGIIQRKREKVYFDDIEVDENEINECGWYVGNSIYSKGMIKKEKSTRKALEYAIKKHKRYACVLDIAEDFHLSMDKLDYVLSRNCEWEKWRASMAVGYACNKKIYCFPWMNTLQFFDCMYNSSVFLLFKKIVKEGAIIILPTSRKENVLGLVDEIVFINSPRYNRVISESLHFKQNY